MLIEHHIKIYKRLISCTFCKTTFTNYDDLRKHHHESHKNNTECEFCHTVFNNAFDLQCHYHNAGLNTGYCLKPCKYCGKKFKWAASHRNHMKLHKKAPDQQFPCQICGHVFATELARRQHVKKEHPNLAGSAV